MPASFGVLDKFNPDKNFQMVEFAWDAPMLEVELNEMQKIQNEARAAMLRSQMHSGVLDLPTPTFSTTTLNGFVIPKFKALINGYLLTVQNFGGKTDGTNLITLPDPDITGSREDLVFLEAWFEEIDYSEVINQYGGAGNTAITNDLKDSRIGAETTRRIQLKWRLRTVSNVNFITYALDGFTKDTNSVTNDTYDSSITAQGGNVSPTTTDVGLFYLNYKQRNSMIVGNGHHVAIDDVGLYIAGSGNSADKTTLQTYDGYSYAIPLFRVKRRNSSGYSPSNAGGAVTFTKLAITNSSTSNVPIGGTAQVTVSSTSGYYIGDLLDRITNSDGTKAPSIFIIDSIDSSTTMTVRNIMSYGVGLGTSYSFARSDHPQSLYSNVIDSRDITDLRHRTQVQYNYDYELKRGSDQFQRGELQQKKLMKVYHGIPKSETDINTVFYASLDGTLTPEVGGSGAMNLGTGSFKPMPTGSGYKFNGDSVTPVAVTGLDQNKGSIDFSVNPQDLKNESVSQSTLVAILDSSNNTMFRIYFVKASMQVSGVELYSDSTGNYTNPFTVNSTLSHLVGRLSWDATNLYLRINGVLFSTIARKSSSVWYTPAKIVLGGNGTNSANSCKSTQSDVHVSNIDRGAIFPNLPPDFISGDAIIMPAYTNQRCILSQAQMTQTVNGIAKAKASDVALTSRGLKRGTIGVADTWSSGDTITITGMAGELISGVFDADTALAKPTVINLTASNVIPVDDVSKFTVGDTVVLYKTTTGYTVNLNITAVDTTNKTITVNTPMTFSGDGQQYIIIETTSTSSVPTVNFLNSGTKTAITGTWTNLGTNVATFTLGTNASLLAQDIQIDYSLIMPSGQPALTAPTTTTLMGEAGIRIPSSLQTITSDFSGKVSGQTWENCNIAKWTSGGASLLSPSSFTGEIAQLDYSNLSTLNSSIVTSSRNTNGYYAQQLFSFDLIKIAERKLGCKIPAKDTAGKVAWLKAGNLSVINFNWWGYGSSPSGTKAYLKFYRDGAWLGTSYTGNSTVTKINYYQDDVSKFNYVDSNGFVHLLAYADPSDGTTPSVINTDYVSLDITFANKIVNSSKLITGQTVHVRDDFAGKVAGDTTGNPNVVRHNSGGGNTSLLSPSTFNSSKPEPSNSEYTSLSTLDNSIVSASQPNNGGIPQHFFSYNLIRIYEDKYGPIPALDKVQWLKDNLASITCNWWGYGSGPLGNKAYVKPWYVSDTSWHDWSSVTTSASVAKLNPNTASPTAIQAMIDSNGFVHFLAYADPSDGVTASTIYTDYCNIELTLKTPTGYDILSPENPRRDAGMSSILFVRKETKEVQPFLGHDTPLNLASYSEYIPAPDPISANTDVTILAEIPEFLVTDLGSAVGYKQGTHHWMNPAYHVRQDNDNLYGEIGFSSVPFAPDSVGVNVGAKVTIRNGGFYSNFTKQYTLNSITKPLISIYRALVLINGELQLAILAQYNASGSAMIWEWSTNMMALISLSGKPLTKEIDGIVRSGLFSPTTWKTNPLVVEGFVDKATGQLITTYA